MKKVLSLIIVLCSLPLVAMAAPPQEPLYFGGGLSHNSASVSEFGAKLDVSGTGFQFFGGYEFGNLGVRNNKVNFAGEVGYMDTGNMKGNVTATVLGITVTVPVEVKDKGLWAAGVVRYSASPQVDVLGRLGFDLGDDSGLMFGVGVGYWFDKKIQLRGEYVVRDTVNSLQLNMVFRM
ncbi:MAG TPA: outer membrane beta-barrel protein [Acidiferrobacterales bacterium]|nr:outer membrane beta-barrel protein [Acidiferrobacterales bacterium]